MLAGVKQIHKPDYRSACSLTLSLSRQQMHSYISFLNPWDYWIFANINPWLYVPLPYSSKKFKEETLLLSVLEIFQLCFPTCFPQRDNKGVQSFRWSPWHQQMFSATYSPQQISCGFHSLHCPSQREILHWAKYKMRLFWGATRIAQLTLHWAGCGRTPLHSKEPHQHWRKKTQVRRTWCGPSFWVHVQPQAVPAVVPQSERPTFHWTPGLQVSNSHIKNETF